MILTLFITLPFSLTPPLATAASHQLSAHTQVEYAASAAPADFPLLLSSPSVDTLVNSFSFYEWDDGPPSPAAWACVPTQSSPVGFVLAVSQASYRDFTTLNCGFHWVDTTLGDATLDGTVNFLDYSKLLVNYTHTGNWLPGDFNYDGVVNFLDYSILLTDYGRQEGGASVRLDVQSVPEPAGLAVLGLFIPLLIRRRK